MKGFINSNRVRRGENISYEKPKNIRTYERDAVISLLFYITLVLPALTGRLGIDICGLNFASYIIILIVGGWLLGFYCSYQSLKVYLIRSDLRVSPRTVTRIFLIFPLILLTLGMAFPLVYFSGEGSVYCSTLMIIPIIVGIMFSLMDHNYEQKRRKARRDVPEPSKETGDEPEPE